MIVSLYHAVQAAKAKAIVGYVLTIPSESTGNNSCNLWAFLPVHIAEVTI